MWIDLQGSRSPTRPGPSTPIHPSWPSFHRSPSSTRYPRLSKVMKVNVFDIPIPINAEIVRCIKVQDVFHLKAGFEPNHFRCQVKPNIILNGLRYPSITFVNYFILHLKSSVLISLGSDVKPANNTLRAGWSISEHSALNSNTLLGCHKYDREVSAHLIGKGTMMYLPREFPFTAHVDQSGLQNQHLCTLLIDSLRLHWCRIIYGSTQAIPQFHCINLFCVPTVCMIEQLLPLFYFISQSDFRSVLFLNHQHPYPRTSAATNQRSFILHEFSWRPYGQLWNGPHSFHHSYKE